MTLSTTRLPENLSEKLITKIKENKYEITILGVFTLISFILILNHEPWRDEALAWLIARDSPSILDIFSLTGNQGHPGLWYLILYPLSHLGLPYISLQFINFFIMLGALIIFLKQAPFSKLHKSMFIFGYLIIYEYNIIARNYAIVILLLFLIASVYKTRFTNFSFPICIFLLCSTHIVGLIIGLVLFFFYFIEFLFKILISNNVEQDGNTIRKIIFFLILMVIGIIISIIQLIPPDNLSPTLARWNFTRTIEEIIKIIGYVFAGAFIPIPRPEISFWNNLISYSFIGGGLSIILFFFSILFFIRKPIPMMIYLSCVVGILSLFIFKYIGSVRIKGLIFIIFIFTLWISGHYKEKITLTSKNIPGKLKEILKPFLIYLTQIQSMKKVSWKTVLSIALTIILSIQMIGSPIAIYYELNYEFSAGEQVATFLIENNFINDETFIATYPAHAASSILPYIQPPFSQFYGLEYEDFFSYTIWTEKWELSRYLSTEEILWRMDEVQRIYDYNILLLILNEHIIDINFTQQYSLMFYYAETIVPTESFYVYQLI